MTLYTKMRVLSYAQWAAWFVFLVVLLMMTRRVGGLT